MRLAILLGLALSGLFLITPVWSAQELSDNELDQVTAAGISEVADRKLEFHFGEDRGQRSVDVTGTMEVRKGSLESISLPDNLFTNGSGAIILRDSAQGNLRAFVNVNAVNSLVQILINLNININSTVGTLRQVNRVQRF